MKNENKATREIQNKIGYEFRNTDLMFQAFVRKSYSEENGGENVAVIQQDRIGRHSVLAHHP